VSASAELRTLRRGPVSVESTSFEAYRSDWIADRLSNIVNVATLSEPVADFSPTELISR
jgi:hypothetical protein